MKMRRTLTLPAGLQAARLAAALTVTLNRAPIWEHPAAALLCTQVDWERQADGSTLLNFTVTDEFARPWYDRYAQEDWSELEPSLLLVD